MKFIQFIIIQVEGNKNIIRYAQLENTKNINIDNNDDDKEMLEDMIAVAFKDALKKIEATSNQKMGGLMPPGMNLPI